MNSLVTDLAANSMEICRRAMGGHGFGGGEELIQLNNDYLSKPAVEGEQDGRRGFSFGDMPTHGQLVDAGQQVRSSDKLDPSHVYKICGRRRAA